MKYSLLSFVLLPSFFSVAQAQSSNPATWCPPGATWTYGWAWWSERGTLTVQSTLAPEARKTIQRLDRSIRRASWMIVSAALLISGVMLRIERSEEPAGRWLLALSALTFLWGVLARR